ncbi:MULTISPECIES: hypothetical protein [Streptomyces]|uniref:CdiI immunity protein domain-containing protein n=1 Tax=Streptomyces luteosporeus TaxID=173856 RepID=A0ABN3U2N5_9ACTN
MEDSTEYRSEVRGYARAMLSGSMQPYDAALEIWGRSGRQWPGDDGDEACYSLQLIWGALTDLVEIEPAGEKARIEAQMVEAAREWLTVEGDKSAEDRYFDRWLHDVLGYERPGTTET